MSLPPHITEDCGPQGDQVTCPRLTGGTLCTPGPGWQLRWDSHLCPASQARMPFLSICFVCHLFGEEKNYPTNPEHPSHQPAVYSVHRWPQERWGRLHVTHYNPAPGLGGEAFWPAGDSSLQRNKKAPSWWMLSKVLGLLQDFLWSLPSL